MTLKTKILIVDDYPENIHALANLIDAPDVEIHSTTKPEEALEMLTHHDFGLALLDVQMPIMSGFELAKLIRGVKRFRQIPIIFVTAHQQDSAVIFQGYETGAVDLLFKPLDPQVVRSKVRVFVEMDKQKHQLQAHVKELEKLRIEADAANIAKSQFLANMSHEIRTPLAAVMGFADLVVRDTLTEKEKKDCVDSISRNGELLLRLIDDILDLSKIEANRLELEREHHCLTEILRDVESTLSFKAADKGVSLNFRIPESTKTTYLIDPLRFKQILLNIVGNAIKFTPTGEVSVDVLIQEFDDLNDLLRVQVKDEGVGMTEAQSRRLFQPFGQADASTKRRFGGTGLGLVISRQIARAMNGDIRLLSSEVDKGSTFEISVKLEKSSHVSGVHHKNRSTEIFPGQSIDLTDKRILAVDDSKDNLVLLEMYLRSTGALLTFAGNGQQAVDAVRSGEYDMILMDIQMPNMDGREATELIRKGGFDRPIVALTAHATRTEHDKCLDSGCDDVLVKPVAKTNLISLLNKYLPPHTASSV